MKTIMTRVRRASTSLLIVALAPGVAACAAHAIDQPPVVSTTSTNLTLHTAENPGATFEAYKTFSFGTSEGAAGEATLSPQAQEVQRRLLPLVAGALIEKGYSPAATGRGDLVVVARSGARQASSPTTAGAGWLPDDENRDFVDGSLVVDVFDGAHGHWVWHGASQASIHPDAIDPQRLEQAVRDLLGSFPTAGSRAEAPTP